MSWDDWAALALAAAGALGLEVRARRRARAVSRQLRRLERTSVTLEKSVVRFARVVEKTDYLETKRMSAQEQADVGKR